MQKTIIHIPHASGHIPSYEGYVANEDTINHEILKLTDWHTDNLFDIPGNNHLIIEADFSRVFCDVERFENDADEPMAAKGMGVLYTTTDDGKPLREVIPKLRERILNDFYRPHHQRLTRAVAQQLEGTGEAIIIDAHSFSATPFIRDHDQNPNRPDFCLGTDTVHTPNAWIQIAKDYFREMGHSLAINRPYAGTIVPLDYYEKDDRVKSIMLEVNRGLYMEEGTIKRVKAYNLIKMMVADFLKKLQML
jgi:N-formylglutamate deformylase